MFHPRNASRAVVIIASAFVVGGPAHAVDEPTLGATVIDGSSAYTPTQLFAAYRDQLGRPINTSSTQAILTHIESLYMRDGYSRPDFRLDEDLATAGILRIQVFEAQITRVAFTGDAGPYAARLEELASDLSLRMPLRAADLQAGLRSMRELPGLTVHASTRCDESRRNAYALTVATEYTRRWLGPRSTGSTSSRPPGSRPSTAGSRQPPPAADLPWNAGGCPAPSRSSSP